MPCPANPGASELSALPVGGRAAWHPPSGLVGELCVLAVAWTPQREPQCDRPVLVLRNRPKRWAGSRESQPEKRGVSCCWSQAGPGRVDPSPEWGEGLAFLPHAPRGAPPGQLGSGRRSRCFLALSAPPGRLRTGPLSGTVLWVHTSALVSSKAWPLLGEQPRPLASRCLHGPGQTFLCCTSCGGDAPASGTEHPR